MKIKIHLTSILICISFFGFAQMKSETKKYAVEELQEDFAALRSHIEQKNPITYLYTSKASINEQFKEIEKSINHPMTELEFYQLISPVSSMIKDGHNLIMPSDDWLAEFDKSLNHFPLHMRLLDDELYLIRNMSNNDAISLADKIITINGISTKKIIEKLLIVLPREGNQTQYPEYLINQWFYFFYPIHFGLDEQYIIQYENENRKLQKALVKGETLDTIITRRKRKYPKGEKEKSGINVKIIDKKARIAILSIPTFATAFLKNKYNQKNFKKEINKAFVIINQENIQHLIIDVRSNGGGNPAFTAYTLKYLFDEPFEQAQIGRVVKNTSEEDLIKRTKKKWFPWYGIGTFKPKRQSYKNDLYVFTNGGTFSSAVEFVSTLKKYNRATFIGTETGGNPIIMTGNYLKESRTLPNTKIKHYSGFICTIYSDLKLNKGRGLIPDYQVDLTLNEVLSNTDKCLDITMNLINKLNN